MDLLISFFVFLVTFVGILEYKARRTLKNYPPGPIPLPIVGNVLSLLPNPQKELKKLVAKYGPILGFQFGYYKGVIISDASYIRELFSNPIVQGAPKLLFFHSQRYKNKFLGISSAEGQEHTDTINIIRRTMKDILSSSSKLDHMLLEEIEDEIKDLKQVSSQDKLMTSSHLFNVLTVSLIWRLMVGERAKREDKQFQAIVKLAVETLDSLGPSSPAFFFPWVCKIAPELSGWNGILTYTKKISLFMDGLLEKHKSSVETIGAFREENFTDIFLEKISKTTDPNSIFHPTYGYEHIKACYHFLIMAGADTVATELQWALLHLMTIPGLQEKLYAEIETVIGRERRPSLSDRDRMPYLASFIQEVLRYNAITPLGAPHTLLGDIDFHGYTIPGGTLVMADLYGVLHDEVIWGEDAGDFNPDRFLDSKTPKSIVNLAFSAGKHLCPGEWLARNQMFIYLATLMQTFAFDLDDPQKTSLEPDPTKIVLAPKPYSFHIKMR